MGLGTSLFLIAVGAILRFAITVTAHGFNIHTIGVILMVIGVIGLIISLFWMTVWSRRRDGYAIEDPAVRRPPEYYSGP